MRTPGVLIAFLLLSGGLGVGMLLGQALQDDVPHMTADVARLAELEAEIQRLRARAQGVSPTTEVQGAPRPSPHQPQLQGHEDARSRGTSQPAATPPSLPRGPLRIEDRSWRGSHPFEVPKGLEGTPKVWLEALRHAVQHGDTQLLVHARAALAGLGTQGASLMEAAFADESETEVLRLSAWDALRTVDASRATKVLRATLSRIGEASTWRSQLLRRFAASRPTTFPPRAVVELLDNGDEPAGDRDAILQALMSAAPLVAIAELKLMLGSREQGERARAVALLRTATRPEFRDLLLAVIPTLPEGQRGQFTAALAAMKGKAWDDVQATGAPDTWTHADYQTAWASRKAEEGLVTLTLTFATPVVPERIRVHESFNPGAVVRIETQEATRWVTVYEGEAARAAGPRWFAPSLATGLEATRTVRLTLNTTAVKGWNEVDAVELVGDGQRQWAQSATSSSCYARR